MWRAWLGQAWRALMAAQSSATLLDKQGPTRWNVSERPQGESHAAPAVQWGWPLLRAEPSVHTCCQSAGTRHRRARGKGGGGSVFLEELFIREVIAEPVRSSEKRLRRIKNAGAAEGVSHGRPYADAQTKQRGVRPPFTVAPLCEGEGFNYC